MSIRLPGWPDDPPDLSAHEAEIEPETQLAAGLHDLAARWDELGIDPDDFIRCAACGGFLLGDDPPVCACPDETEMP